MPWGDRYKGTEQISGPRKKGGFGSSYNAVTQQAKPKKKSGGHHGVLGFVENLGTDVGKAVVGLGPGLVHTAEHPIRTAKQIGTSYKDTYGPLTHGDLGKFLHNLYEHPLGPILDVATIVTLGSAAGAKAGIIPGEAEALTLRSPAARLGQADGRTVTKLTSHNPAIRARQKLIHNALNRLPAELPLLGETVRFGKELDRLPRQEALRARQALRKYNRAVRPLSNEEFAALHLIERGVHPHDYATFLKRQDHAEPQMLKVLANPKIAELVDSPSDAIRRAMPAYEHLAATDAELKIGRGLMTQETADASAARLHNAVYENLPAREHLPPRAYVPDVLPDSTAANTAFAKMGGGVGVAKLPGSLKHNTGLLARTGRLTLHPDILGPEYLRTIKYGLFDDIHSELMSSAVRIQKGTAVPEGWVYLRKKIVSKTGNPRPQKIHALTQKQGAIESSLQELIGSEGEKLTRDSFQALSESDRETLHGEYLVVPKKLVDTMSGEFHRSNIVVRNFLEKPTKVWRALVLGFRVGFLTNNVVGNHLLFALHAAGIDGLRAYLNAVKREKGAGVVRSLIEDKHLPDPLRQRFMEEFFPEQIQGTFGGTQRPGASKLLRGKKGRKLRAATVGIAPATQALAEGTLRRGLVETFIRKSPQFKKVYHAMPAQTRDFEAAAREVLGGLPPVKPGFVRLYRGEAESRVTNVPSWISSNQGRWFTDDLAGARRYANARGGEVYYADVPEQHAASFATGNSIGQGKEFVVPESVAVKKGRYREPNHEHQAAISRQVNHALGDYLGLSAVEQNAIRAVIPFYAWYKAITTITLHLAADTPGRADLLSKVGQLGSEDTLKKLGSTKDYLEGLIPLGGPEGGQQEVLSTGGLNPFQTDEQLLQGLAGILAGKPGATGKAFSQLGPNPILLGILENMAGKRFFTGHALKSGHGIPGTVLAEIAQQLPQAQLGKAIAGHGRPSTLYGKQSAREAVLQYLGAPIKRIDVKQAQR